MARKATARKATKRKLPKRAAKGTQPSVDRAKAIIKAQIRAGNQRASVVQRAVLGAGISLRTYRTARKQLRTVAVRRAGKGKLRGSGTWYVTR